MGKFMDSIDEDQEDGIFDTLQQVVALGMKPTTGLKGTGIYILRQTAGGVLVIGHPVKKRRLPNSLGD